MVCKALAGKMKFCVVLVGLLELTVAAYPQHVSESDLAAIQSIEAASARRAATAGERRPILDSLHSNSATVRIYAVRALGRLEDPSLASSAAELLSDSSPEVRSEAANALAQTLFAKSTPSSTTAAQQALESALEKESVPQTKAALLESLGRLPYADTASASAAAEKIVSYIAPDRKPNPDVRLGAAIALESLLRAQKGKGASPEVIDALKGQFAVSSTPEAARIRTLSLMALTVAGAADAGVIEQAQKDADQQVRRIAMVAAGSKDAQARLILTPVTDPVSAGQRPALIEAGLADSSPMVRLEALQAYTSYLQATSCHPILKAVADPGVHVPLLALDVLAKPCPAAEKSEVIALLKAKVASLPAQPIEGAGKPTWHPAAHALVSLAAISPADAHPAIPAFLGNPSWEARVYAAKAAAAMNDSDDLRTLAKDPNANVVAASLQGLAKVEGHKADAVYIASLDRIANQIGAAAGRALLGSQDPAASDATIQALAKYTALAKDNTRDARVALLRALKTTGSVANADALRPYVHDFDPAVAALAATLVSGWTGAQVAAEPHREPAAAPDMASDLKLSASHLLITMKSGGVFEIELYPDQAPLTVERMV